MSRECQLGVRVGGAVVEWSRFLPLNQTAMGSTSTKGHDQYSSYDTSARKRTRKHFIYVVIPYFTIETKVNMCKLT